MVQAYKAYEYVYSHLNLPDSSIAKLTKAYQIADRQSNIYKAYDFAYLPTQIAANYLKIYFDNGRKAAIDSAQRFINQFRRNNHLKGRWLAGYYHYQGFIYYAKQNYKSALAYADSSLNVDFDMRENQIILSHKLVLKGFALLKLDHKPEAIQLLKRATDNADDSFYGGLALRAL